MTSDGSHDAVVVDARRADAETSQDAVHWEDCMPSPSTTNLIPQPISLSLSLSLWSVDPADWSVGGQRGQVDNTIISHCSARRLTTYRIGGDSVGVFRVVADYKRRFWPPATAAHNAVVTWRVANDHSSRR